MRIEIFSALAMLTLTSYANATTLGVSVSNLDEFNSTLLRGLITHANDAGGVDVVTTDAKGDGELQKKQVAELVARKVDALIVLLADGDLAAQLTPIAFGAGIPLVYVNNVPANVLDLPPNQAVVASDEKQSGFLQAKEVCRLLNGRGNVAVLIGEPFHAAARARTEDVDDVLATPECNGLKVVERQTAYWSPDFAEAQVQEWLTAGVEFDAILANNDDMALGAIRALKHSASTKDVIVAGIDAIHPALEAMKAGELAVTVFQNAAAQGEGAVDAALKLAQGQKVPRENDIPFELVTPQNVDQYLANSQ
ncbi:ABC-type sugar transport system, periplasmic component [Rhizobium leguminosarum bv. trifolii WSM597]|uniref:ABC-type sugar transport system, periplasmic component n=1 Tax=Rhizobium leguminosarum bv. trifolii WSM597 TaxID=754764 RepID=I9NJS2_RHILT|nr:substrate-binding domain-containing protein [Rhizobium leguminosarum]EJB08214.1 ABC-type sugar transport system, periplasmic component [Rhizobium leguminosarum bv. trifolii WSM597]